MFSLWFECACVSFASAIQPHATIVPPLLSDHHVKAATDSNSKVLKQQNKEDAITNNRNNSREKVPNGVPSERLSSAVQQAVFDANGDLHFMQVEASRGDTHANSDAANRGEEKGEQSVGGYKVDGNLANNTFSALLGGLFEGKIRPLSQSLQLGVAKSYTTVQELLTSKRNRLVHSTVAATAEICVIALLLCVGLLFCLDAFRKLRRNRQQAQEEGHTIDLVMQAAETKFKGSVSKLLPARCLACLACAAFAWGVGWKAVQENKCAHVERLSNSNMHLSNSDYKTLHGSAVPAANTSQQAPKIIWSFWGRFRTVCFNSAPCETPCFGPQNKNEPYPVIVRLSIDSWKKLNPDYEVRMLDDVTMWNYLDRAELPRAFECLDVVHVSDVVRLALLVKYGGVWLDASMVTLKPLTQILNDVRHPATYVEWSSGRYVENYMLADSPDGMILPEVKACVWKFYESAGYTKPRFSWRPWCLALWPFFERSLGAAGQYFSAHQLAALEGYGITGYYETHACFVKVLDERRDIQRWFDSSAVKKVDPWQVYTLQFIKGWTPYAYGTPLLDEVDDDLANQLLKTALVLKFSASRHGFDKSLNDLRCTESTLKAVLSKSGLVAPEDCT